MVVGSSLGSIRTSVFRTKGIRDLMLLGLIGVILKDFGELKIKLQLVGQSSCQ